MMENRNDNPSVKLEKLEEPSDWAQMCLDFYRGAVSVKGNKTYLPQWEGESDDAYKVRQAATLFPNMFAPIVTGVAGLVTKEEPSATDLEALDLLDVDMRGTGLVSFVKQVCEMSIVCGVEFVAVESTESRNRVFLKRYPYTSLMSYQIEDGEVTQMVFKDKIERPQGKFGISTGYRYVVFRKNGGQVWINKGGDAGFEVGREWSNSLNAVPVVAVRTGRELSRFEVVPRMYDIAEMNRVLYNNESQLANVLNVVGNPIPMFFGNIKGDAKISVGVRDALNFLDRTKEGLYYAEIHGDGVAKIEAKIKSTKDAINSLSLSLLEKGTNRTVIDAQQSESKNNSFLADVAVELETKFNKLLVWMAALSNVKLPANAWLGFKKDFGSALFTNEQLKLFEKMVSDGNLSVETLLTKLLEEGLLPDGFDIKSELEKIEAQNAA